LRAERLSARRAFLALEGGRGISAGEGMLDVTFHL